jgi:AAA+ superfamily predicted ATPase
MARTRPSRAAAAAVVDAPVEGTAPTAPGAPLEPAAGADASPPAALADALLARLVVAERAARDGDDDPLRAADDAVDVARRRFVEALGEPTPFSALVANGGLAVPDAEVLALAVACETDARRQRLVAHLHEDAGRTRLTLGLVERVFGADHAGVLTLGPDAALRCTALVTVEPDGAWVDHVVVVEPAVVWALLGDGSRDPDVPIGGELVETELGGGAPLTVVTGRDRVRRWQTAAAGTAGVRFLVVSAPATEEGWAAVVREATVTGCGVIVELDDGLPVAGRRWVERARHLPWALTSREEIPLEDLPDRRHVELEAPLDEPTDEEWEEVVGAGVPRSHRLTPEQLRLVERVLPARAHDLDASVRRLGSGKLDRLARHIRPRRTWDDIVLDAERKEQMRTIVHRYRYADRVYRDWGFEPVPSSGVVALFVGPSGTGKTMAAEIVAGDLGLDLYKLDLSSVVSKYIGETEKNLEGIFDAAGAGNLVLFFDEADALFGKRSEVRDARDRYANIEVSYLLQRLESYDGLVVMATNFEKNIDEAFLRRIHVRVEFATPGPEERAAIWELNLPRGAPRGDDVDLTWLAERFELTGAAIRNAAVAAAFAAAAEASPITMTALVRGVAKEYVKLGRLVRPEDFGDRYELLG